MKISRGRCSLGLAGAQRFCCTHILYYWSKGEVRSVLCHRSLWCSPFTSSQVLLIISFSAIASQLPKLKAIMWVCIGNIDNDVMLIETYISKVHGFREVGGKTRCLRHSWITMSVIKESLIPRMVSLHSCICVGRDLYSMCFPWDLVRLVVGPWTIRSGSRDMFPRKKCFIYP